MSNTCSLPRRTFVTATAATIGSTLAGCMGSDDGDGGPGELVAEATFEGNEIWTFDLEEGQTITVVANVHEVEDGTSSAAGHISNADDIRERYARIDTIAPGEHRMSHTAEDDLEVSVSLTAQNGVDAEIYVD